MVDNHLLELDSFTLSNADEWVEHETAEGIKFRVRTSATNASFGDAVPVTSSLSSGLVLGSLEWISDWENREPTFQVEIAADDALGLAAGAAMLALACADARELRWTPPADNGPVTVHDLQWARIEEEFDDLREMGTMPVRVVNIRMCAEPFPRSADLTVVPAIGTGTGTTSTPPTVTPIYDGTTTASWSVLVGSSAVQLAGGGVQNVSLMTQAGILNRAAAVTMGTDRWLRVEFAATGSGAAPRAWITPSSGAVVAPAPSAVIGSYAYYYMPSSGSLSAVGFMIEPGSRLTIEGIARQDKPPFVSNSRQQVRQFEVGGSAPTQGAIRLWHDTLALGQTMLCTWEEDGSGYVPPIGHLVASQPAPTSDSTAVLGAYWPVTSTSTTLYFDVLAANLIEGDHAVLVRGKLGSSSDPAAVTVRATATTRLGGLDVWSQSDQRWANWATDWRIQAMAMLTLPPTKVPRGSGATVRVSITLPTAGDKLCIDNVYLVNADLCDLTIINCGTGTPAAGGASNRAWLDAATNDGVQGRAPRSPIYVGTLADRSDARHVAGTDVIAAVAHRFPPGKRTNALTVSMAPDIGAEFSQYNHWTGFAAS